MSLYHAEEATSDIMWRIIGIVYISYNTLLYRNPEVRHV
jgi:hypothetical protein